MVSRLAEGEVNAVADPAARGDLPIHHDGTRLFTIPPADSVEDPLLDPGEDEVAA